MDEAAVFVLVAFATPVALLLIPIGYNAWQGQEYEWHCLHGIACTIACAMALFLCTMGPAAPTTKTQ